MHVFLIGYRGSGKSTVGKLLATHLGWHLVDTDEWIESDSGMTICQIFAEEGESGFRDREETMVARAAALPEPTVVSLGGGAVLRDANQRRIQESGNCVWLAASAEFLFQRINRDASSDMRRPNLSDRGGFEEVAEVLAFREPIYRRLAGKIVNTEGRTPDEVVEEIGAWVKSNAQ